jgi:hypothetical protein
MKTMSISPESFSSRSGLGGFESGEVLHYGTYEEDAPVTWEVLVFPWEIRWDGEPVIHLQS